MLQPSGGNIYPGLTSFCPFLTFVIDTVMGSHDPIMGKGRLYLSCAKIPIIPAGRHCLLVCSAPTGNPGRWLKYVCLSLTIFLTCPKDKTRIVSSVSLQSGRGCCLLVSIRNVRGVNLNTRLKIPRRLMMISNLQRF